MIDSSDVWMTAVGGNAWRYAQLHFVSVISVISYSIFISLHSHLTYWCVLYFFDEISGRLIGFSFAATILNNQCRERFAVVWKKKDQTGICRLSADSYYSDHVESLLKSANFLCFNRWMVHWITSQHSSYRSEAKKKIKNVSGANHCFVRSVSNATKWTPTTNHKRTLCVGWSWLIVLLIVGVRTTTEWLTTKCCVTSALNWMADFRLSSSSLNLVSACSAMFIYLFFVMHWDWLILARNPIVVGRD